MGCICDFGSCYLHQNRLTRRNLYDIDNIVFVVSAVADVIAVVVGMVVEVVGTADYPSI
jgi:hypothetical protein